MIIINDSHGCSLTFTCILCAPHHRSAYMHVPLLQASVLPTDTIIALGHTNLTRFSHVPRRNKTPLAATRRKANPFKNSDHQKWSLKKDLCTLPATLWSADWWMVVHRRDYLSQSPCIQNLFFFPSRMWAERVHATSRIGTQRPPTRLPSDPLDPLCSQTSAGSPKSQDSLRHPPGAARKGAVLP